MEILNYDEQPAGSYAIAIFDIYFGGKYNSIINRLKLCRSKNGNLYVKSFSYKKGEFEGKPQWGEIVDHSGEGGRLFQKDVLEALKPFIK
jgi:hypothetical protein